jgi:hypothetical protein
MTLPTSQEVTVIVVCIAFFYKLDVIVDVLKRIEKTLDDILDGQTEANKKR